MVPEMKIDIDEESSRSAGSVGACCGSSSNDIFLR